MIPKQQRDIVSFRTTTCCLSVLLLLALTLNGLATTAVAAQNTDGNHATELTPQVIPFEPGKVYQAPKVAAEKKLPVSEAKQAHVVSKANSAKELAPLPADAAKKPKKLEAASKPETISKPKQATALSTQVDGKERAKPSTGKPTSEKSTSQKPTLQKPVAPVLNQPGLSIKKWNAQPAAGSSQSVLTQSAKPEPAKPEPAKPEPAKTELKKPEPAKTEPVKPEPVKPELKKPEPVKPEPAKPEPVKPEPTKTEPVKPELKKPESAKPEPEKPELKKPEPAKPEPAKPEPAKPEPVKPEPAKPEPAKPEPVKPEPAKPELKKPEPTKTEPANPAPSGQSIQFENHIDAIDPNAENNPKGAKSQGFRGENQLVVYSASSGEHTGTNKAGVEAVVINNIVTELKSGNAPIPNNGFVISGHGSSAQWMRRIIKRGETVQVDPDTKKLTVEITPRVYFNQIEADLERITALSPEEVGTRQASLTTVMGQIEDCQIRLKQLIPGGKVTPQVLETFQECRRLVNQAYIQVVSSNPNEFRGIWVRPLQNSTAEIEHIIADLKALKIHDIFLETYYQGKTIYPSQVMLDYGLPKQHRQFEGTDILKEWIDSAHAQGLRVHTWVQVFFAGNQQDAADSMSDLLTKYPDWRNVQYAARNQTVPVPSSIETGHYFLDPAHPQSRQFLTQLMQEIVSRYHPDGINFDYIRYPESAKPGAANYLDTTWGYTSSAQKAFPVYVAWLKQQLRTLQQTEQKRIQALVQTHQYFPPMFISPVTPLNPASYSPASQKTLAGLGLTSNLVAALQKEGDEAALIKTDPFVLTPSEPLWPLWIRWRRSQVTSWLKQTQAELKKIQPNLTVSTVVFPLSDPESTVKLQSWPQWVKEGLVDALTPIGLNPTASGVFQDGLNFLNQTQGKVPVYAGIFGIYNRYDPVDVVAQINAVHRAGLAGVVLFEYSRLKDEYRDALKQGPFRE